MGLILVPRALRPTPIPDTQNKGKGGREKNNKELYTAGSVYQQLQLATGGERQYEQQRSSLNYEERKPWQNN